MVYNTNNLASVAECDIYLQELNTEQSQLGIQQGEVQMSITNNTTMAASIPTQLQVVEGVLATRQAEHAVATDPQERRVLEIQINSLENKRLRLLNRQAGLAGTGLLDKQFTLAKIESEIDSVIEFKTAIETRKAEILSSAAAA